MLTNQLPGFVQHVHTSTIQQLQNVKCVMTKKQLKRGYVQHAIVLILMSSILIHPTAKNVKYVQPWKKKYNQYAIIKNVLSL